MQLKLKPRSRRVGLITLVALGPMLVSQWCAAPAEAQRDVVQVQHPGGLMTLQVEDARILSWAAGSPPVTQNWQRPSGRFRLLTGVQPPLGGDPRVYGDENRPVVSQFFTTAGPTTAAPTYDRFTSKLTISVDGELYDLSVLGDNASEQTRNPLNFWPVPPTPGSRDAWGVARLPLDPGVTRANLDPNETTEYFDIQHRFTLIHDAVRIEYVVTNYTTRTQAVGLRQLIDATFGQLPLDGGTIVLPNGQRIVSERVIPDADATTVPDSWLAYDRLDDPGMILRGTLEARDVHEPGVANTSAGKPDRIEFGLMRSMGANEQWDFVPNPAVALAGEDWAYAARWDEADLAPGRSRRYVTYFGLGVATVDYDSPYAMAAYSPVRLHVQEGDDPTTPDEVERFYITDREGRSVFPVHVYADNFFPSPLVDASVRISLPEGLELDPPTQSLSKSLGTVARNELRSVSWTVRARAARPGVATISFTGPLGKVVRRHIEIPLVPALLPTPGARGLEMVSVPFTFVDNSVEHVFQSLGSMHVGGGNGLAAWNPEELQYRWFPHADVTTVAPGKGYWLLNLSRRPVYLPPDMREVSTDAEYSVYLRRGWNQIGTPFTQQTFLAGVRVIDPYGGEWSMREAADRGLIMPTLFRYDAVANEYRWMTELVDVNLAPYTGYWVYAMDNLTLLFSSGSLFTRSVGASEQVGAAASDGDWKTELVVSAGGRVRAGRNFGMAAGASDGVDLRDVLAPPAVLPDGVRLSATLVHPQSGQRFMQDIRAQSGASTEWLLSVETSAVGEPVTVSWPDMSALPPDLVATFEDTVSGDRRYMRTHSGHTYRAADDSARLFKITVQPRSAHRALVTSASVTQGSGGASIVYTLAGDAAVDLEIRNISGVLIRRVASDQLRSAGVNTQAWDGRNALGAAVPAGRYLCRVMARSPVTGEQHSMVTSFQLAR